MYSRVYVEITNICNMHCSFCHGHSRTPARMTEAQFAHILEQLRGQTKYIYFHLMGEPLTHPELPQFLKMAAQSGFYPMLTTNGTLLKKRGQAILEAGVHKISISLHSFEGEDDRFFEAYLQEVADFADAAADFGSIVCLRLWNKGFDKGRNETAAAFLRARLQGEWKENTRGIRIRDRLFLEYGDRFQWPDLKAPVQGEQVFCHGMRDQFGILCDGSVVPCCLDSEGAITLGNIYTQDIAKILSSPRAQEMVKGFSCRRATEELCRRCGYAQRFMKKISTG